MLNFKYIVFKINRYNFKTVYDKNYTKLFDSRATLITSRTDIDFRIYLNRTYFTDLDKSKAGQF